MTLTGKKKILTSESEILKRVMLAVSKKCCRIFRNNVGLFKTIDGRTVKTGLCKGSSDLIGWTEITITKDMVGAKIAAFTAIETKTKTGRLTKEQRNFLRVVEEAGGVGIVARSGDDALRGIDEFRLSGIRRTSTG